MLRRRKRGVIGSLVAGKLCAAVAWSFSIICVPQMWAGAALGPLVRAVESVGMTVADADRSIDFYSRVLLFQKVSDVEFEGSDYEHLEGVFGLRMRVVSMRLGDESIELT